MFWQDNKFMHTILANQNTLRARLTHPRILSSWKLMRHLEVRVYEGYHKDLFEHTCIILRACAILPNLRTLHIHIMRHRLMPNISHLSRYRLILRIAEARFMFKCGVNVVEYKKKCFQSKEQFIVRYRPEYIIPLEKRRPFGHIREVMFTGLPGDAYRVGPLLVRLFLTILHPQGKIGLGLGTAGIQYYSVTASVKVPVKAPYGVMNEIPRTRGDIIGIVMTRKPQVEWIEATEIGQ